MFVQPIKIPILIPPHDDLLQKIQRAKFYLHEGDIVAVTSKVVSIWQGRCVEKRLVKDKDDLIKKEADYYLDRRVVPGGHIIHTLKENFLIASAGIDESNGDGYYILWPLYPHRAARSLQLFFKKKYKVNNLGVIITDSHSMPLRRGVVGFALGWAGINPLYDYRKSRDLFGRQLKVTQANIVDALAAAAVVVMGEGAEQTPIALIRNVPYLAFKKSTTRRFSSFQVRRTEDLFAPFLNRVPWKRRRT